jgi:hypothetical protein
LKLLTYEEAFRAQHGRPIKFREDIRPVEAQYERYKNLKEVMSGATKE